MVSDPNWPDVIKLSQANLNSHTAHGLFCPLLGTRQCAWFSFPSLVMKTGWFCCLEWNGMSNCPQHILAIKQHFLERMCINLDYVLDTTTHHKDEWLMDDLCLVSYEGGYFGDAETSVLLWNWQDRLVCSSLVWCYCVSLHYFSLFDSLAMSISWAPGPLLSVPHVTWCDNEEPGDGTGVIEQIQYILHPSSWV